MESDFHGFQFQVQHPEDLRVSMVHRHGQLSAAERHDPFEGRELMLDNTGSWSFRLDKVAGEFQQ